MKTKKQLSVKNAVLVGIDLIMMVLLIVNLCLLVFDYLFSFLVVSDFLKEYTPEFHSLYYEWVHVNFFEIDLVFISIFLLEFVISWGIAIYQKIYHRWFFYPFLHWYDLIGCIPIGSLRFARLFRVFSIMYRLQKLNLIDVSKTYLFQTARRYYDIMVEEVSDRVVLNVLTGVQAEIRDGGPVVDRIIDEVLMPRKDVIVEWISHKVQKATRQNYMYRKDEVKNYVDTLISEAISQNNQIGTVEQIPIVGKVISSTLERSVSSMVFNVIDGLINDLGSGENKVLIGELLDIAVDTVESEESDVTLNNIAIESFVDILEIVKDKVKVKKWKSDANI